MKCNTNAYYRAMGFEYPWNFMKRIFGDDFDGPIPDDLNKSIEYIIKLDVITNGDKNRKQRYKDILKYRYKKGWSLQAVADQLGICVEMARINDNRLLDSIRQIYSHKGSVINKLLTIGLTQYLDQKESTADVDLHISELKINRKIYNALIRANKTTIGDIIETGADLRYIQNINENSINIINKAIKALNLEFNPEHSPINTDIYNKKDKKSIAISELNIRYVKYLKDAGINTVGDLVKLSNTEIFNIPGFNVTTFIEVIDELNKLGFKRNYLVDISLIKLAKFRTNN